MIQKHPLKRTDRFEQERQSIQDINQFSSVVHALQSTSRDSRKEAARKLGELGLEDAVEPLSLALFDEEDVSVRIQIIEALSQIGTDGAIAGIMDVLDDPDDNVRKAAVDALRGVDLDEVSDKVIDELMYLAEEDIDSSVRLAAIDVLFQYEDKKVTQMLSALSSDPEPMIRDAIKRGMEQRVKIEKPKAKVPERKAKSGRRQRIKR
jgi:HEAT repeat protein